MKLELPAEVLSLLNSMTKRIDELETRLEKIEQSDNEKAELIEKLKSDIHNFVQERDTWAVQKVLAHASPFYRLTIYDKVILTKQRHGFWSLKQAKFGLF